jgi:chloride channel protein, CIC family
LGAHEGIFGVVCCIYAVVLIRLLRIVGRLACGHYNRFLATVRSAPGCHYAVALAGTAVVVVGRRILGRLPTSGGLEVSGALWLRHGRLPFRTSLTREGLANVALGLGVSLGREAAPQLCGGATAGKLAGWAQRRLSHPRTLQAPGAL